MMEHNPITSREYVCARISRAKYIDIKQGSEGINTKEKHKKKGKIMERIDFSVIQSEKAN